MIKLSGDLVSSDPFGLVLLVRCVCNRIFQNEEFKLKHKVIQVLLLGIKFTGVAIIRHKLYNHL